MADVKLVNVIKKFGEVVAVDNVSLSVNDGEFLVFLGPSGCGKTTTLRIIAGLEKPDTGRVYIGGQDVTDLHPSERDVAMVFQNYALYPHMKVFDNIAFPLRLRKYSEADIRKRVLEAARSLRIEHLLDRYPKQLSGGEQQRVALARAIVRNPKVFLMDEPLSNLDAKLRILMRAELKKLQKELGVTTIYVTHDQAEAMTMGDRIAVMNKGKIIQIGSPQEIYKKPNSIFVAGFIGSPPMNFIEGELHRVNNRIVFDAGIFKLDVTSIGNLAPESLSGSKVVLGIRPEDIIISDREQPNSVKGYVYVLEPLGSDTIVDVKLGDLIIKVRVTGSVTLEVNNPIWINIPIDKVHLFDEKTEKAII